MILLRIDDVGRVSGDTPEKGTDGDLHRFLNWRVECGLAGLPVYYGVTYNWLTLRSKECIGSLLVGKEKWALHGYSHVRNASENVNISLLREAAAVLQTDVYIPPYNEYGEEGLSSWAAAGGKYFLGGYVKQHLMSNPYLTYIPACIDLYGKATEINDVDKYAASSLPYVLTLHVPWERDTSVVKQLISKVRSRLVGVEAYD